MYSIQLDYHYFQLSNPDGEWFTLRGSRGAGNGSDSTLGQELDILVDWKPYKKTSLKFGHSYFIPTGEGKVIGGKDHSHFTYLWMTVRQ